MSNKTIANAIYWTENSITFLLILLITYLLMPLTYHWLLVVSFKVRVDLLEEKDVCSAAFKRRRFQQMVRVGAQTTRAVPFIIIPMKEGEVKITVKAAITDSETGLSDGIEKKLRVVVSVKD